MHMLTMTAATILSPPNPRSTSGGGGGGSATASATATAAGSSTLGSTNSKRSQSSQQQQQQHPDHAAAAVDLIRNLDKALLGMNAAARSASDNAARARRNARVAGEVARRYGGGKKMKVPPGQQILHQHDDDEQDNVDSGSDNALLEKTRERRSVARMAAEARHRRENPMAMVSASSPSSPLRSIVFETSLFAAEEDADAADDHPTHVEAAVVGDEAECNDSIPTSEMIAGTERGVSPEKYQDAYVPTQVEATVGDDNEAACNDPFPDRLASEMIEGIERGVSQDNFEDAMDHHEDDDFGAQFNDAENGGDLPHANNYDHHNDKHHQYSYYTQQQNIQGQQQDEVMYDQEGGGNGTDVPIHNQHQQQYYDNGGYYYPNQTMQNEHPQSQPVAVPTTVPSPLNTHVQSTNTSRIEDSHVEDVLSLSLELERVRSQHATTVQKLAEATSQISTLKSQNDHLRDELTTLHSQLESHNERSIAQMEQLQVEQYKSKAAEEDALEALELAKESQSKKDEYEMWLYQCLEELDLWKGRCMEWEAKYKNEQMGQDDDVVAVEPKKVVRFKQNVEEDLCYPPPAHGRAAISTPRPPPLPPYDSGENKTSPSFSSPEGSTPNHSIQLFTPTSSAAATATTTTPSSLDDATPLSKSTAIASGRALLYHASVMSSSSSPSSSSTSPSPYKQHGLSPHPRMQAYDLLKKSAETRRLLRERLTPGRLGGRQHGIPLPKHIHSSLSLNTDGFASRQGAACKAVGRAIRESGERLKLNGIWWSSRNGTNDDDNNGLVPREDDVGEGTTSTALALTTYNNESSSSMKTVAELESMVQEYCGRVENTIGQQQRKIDELLAFCDHLEKGVVDMPSS